jgi:lipoprotein-releasing system permease protein
MSRLPFEAFLAFRYLRPRRTFVSVITVISILGVLLGVAVLIIVISVMSGFDQEWRDRILGFNAHIKIVRYQGLVGDYEGAIKVVAQNPEVVGVSPVIASPAMLKSQPANSNDTKVLFPMILGVDEDRLASVCDLPTNIVSGKYDLSRYGLLMGREMALSMGMRVGDTAMIYSRAFIDKLEKHVANTNSEVPVGLEFTLRGIFDVGFSEYNSSFVVVSHENGQLLSGIEDENATEALQVKLRDPFRADIVAAQLEEACKHKFEVTTWKEENPHIFNALAVEKNMMFYLLFFIMIVAGFGIVNCQITFVVQKTREIGILKSLGANNRQILWIFLSQSVVVGVLGVGLGLALALVALHYRNPFLLLMRRVTGADLLPSSVYGVYELPASIQAGDVLFICGAAFLTCVLAGLFPAWKASRMQPVEALRYE